MRLAAAGGILLAALAPALALQPPAGAAEDKVVFTVGLRNEVDSFNPFLGIEAPSFEMWALEYDYLIGYSMDDMQPEPSLASSWETSDDGLTWTFTIRDDVTWSDGEPLTAADVAFTLNRILDGGPEAATWGSYVKGTDTITAPDDTTVVLELKRPNSVLPLLPIPIIPEHIWSDIDEKAVKTFANEPTDGDVVGSGPFRLVSGTAGGSEYRFEANPDYWKGAPHIDEVVFKVYKADDPMIAALKKGEIDFAENLNALQVQALQGEANIQAINGDSPGFDEIAFNTGAIDIDTGKPIGDGNPALQDKAFRHALGYAVDLDTIIEKVYYGAGKAGDTIVPPAYANWKWTPEGDDAFTFDLDKAGQLLDDAGYALGGDGKRTMPDGKPIGTLRLLARADSETSLKTLTFFSEWLGELGIDSKVSTVEEGRLTDLILEGNFDVFEWGWYVEPDPDSMLSYMTCDQLGNWSDSWYCNEQYDALYDQQHAETDDAARIEQVKQMQQLVFEDSPYLVTAYNTIGEAFRTDRFACLRPQPDPGGIYILQYGVYNYLNMRPASEADQCAGEEGVTQASGSNDAEESSGPSTGAMVGMGVAGLAALGGVGFMLARRRSTAGDRE